MEVGTCNNTTAEAEYTYKLHRPHSRQAEPSAISTMQDTINSAKTVSEQVQ